MIALHSSGSPAPGRAPASTLPATAGAEGLLAVIATSFTEAAPFSFTEGVGGLPPFAQRLAALSASPPTNPAPVAEEGVAITPEPTVAAEVDLVPDPARMLAEITSWLRAPLPGIGGRERAPPQDIPVPPTPMPRRSGARPASAESPDVALQAAAVLATLVPTVTRPPLLTVDPEAAAASMPTPAITEAPARQDDPGSVPVLMTAAERHGSPDRPDDIAAMRPALQRRIEMPPVAPVLLEPAVAPPPLPAAATQDPAVTKDSRAMPALHERDRWDAMILADEAPPAADRAAARLLATSAASTSAAQATEPAARPRTLASTPVSGRNLSSGRRDADLRRIIATFAEVVRTAASVAEAPLARVSVQAPVARPAITASQPGDSLIANARAPHARDDAAPTLTPTPAPAPTRAPVRMELRDSGIAADISANPTPPAAHGPPNPSSSTAADRAAPDVADDATSPPAFAPIGTLAGDRGGGLDTAGDRGWVPEHPRLKDGAVPSDTSSANLTADAASAPVLAPPVAQGRGVESRIVATDLRSPHWPRAIAAELVALSHEKVDTATLRLSPEHLGPIEVHIHLQDNVVNLNFGAAHADTRSTLEQAIPQLRDAFAGAGIELGQATVQQETRRESQDGAFVPKAGSVAADDVVVKSEVRRALSLVDEYA